MLAGLAGCNRAYYRERANDEAYQLVSEKSFDPRWEMSGFSIEMDPRSRYYDPYDRDYPPMPPDDPASHEFMICVDEKRGYEHWDEYGAVQDLENPGWREALAGYTQQTEDGKIRLRLEDAMQLATMHAPDYQEQLETVFLSALDVSTERFRFDTQFFGGTATGYRTRGSEHPNGPSSAIFSDSNPVLQRQFAAAGELLVGFANSTVWEFFGSNTSSSTSLLDFTFIQPLLRAGGRAFALEQLTIAERTLLANLRSYQQYRQGFYTNVAIGEEGVSGPSRRGGFLGGTGLTGFSGTGSGGFGGVGAATGFGRGGLGGGTGNAGGGGAGFAGGGAGTVGGFIGLLQQMQQIRNTEKSLEAQLRTLALLEANLDAGLIDIAQVDQFRQAIETERANLLQSQNGFENTLDNFKRSTLGLPPDLELEPDDSIIRPFQLIDPAMSDAQDAITDYITEFGDLPVEPTLAQLEEAFQRTQELQELISEQFIAVEMDINGASRAEEDGQGLRLTPVERSLDDKENVALTKSFSELQANYQEVVGEFADLREQLNQDMSRVVATRLVALLMELSNRANELSLIQARARLRSITIEPVNIPANVALEIARVSRLDWMNNRAALVDTWRLVEFNAIRLKSDLTISVDGDIRTLGDSNPFKFRDQTGSLRASVQFDPPFTRLQERNSFRQQLIDYQQDRRQLIQFEDRVQQNLRQILRDLEQLSTNLEIQRRAVGIAIRRVDQTREALSRPVPPAQPGQPPSTLGPTAAQNLLFALSDLRNTLNNLMSVWLNYQASRMRLYREMGVMRIDENGLWIDEPLEVSILETTSMSPMPPAVPESWWLELNQDVQKSGGEVIVPPSPEEYEEFYDPNGPAGETSTAPPLDGPLFEEAVFQDSEPPSKSHTSLSRTKDVPQGFLEWLEEMQTPSQAASSPRKFEGEVAPANGTSQPGVTTISTQ